MLQMADISLSDISTQTDDRLEVGGVADTDAVEAF